MLTASAERGSMRIFQHYSLCNSSQLSQTPSAWLAEPTNTMLSSSVLDSSVDGGGHGAIAHLTAEHCFLEMFYHH